jgi:hypothetical protein
MILFGLQKRFGCRLPEARRRASDNDELLVAKLGALELATKIGQRGHLELCHPLEALHHLQEQEKTKTQNAHGLNAPLSPTLREIVT